jgi:DNA-directed RNA polymerase subunit RPC12/RpoP
VGEYDCRDCGKQFENGYDLEDHVKRINNFGQEDVII